MASAFRFIARTDVGLVRTRNEDSGYAGPHLLAVADGMGGHAGGNVASSLVLARLAPLDGDSHGADDALDLLATAIADGNRSLAQEAQADPSLTGMGTTLTAIMRAGANSLALVHIGDSRAYLLREQVVTQITKDHSFVQTLVDSGRLTPEEAEHHPQRSLITRVLTGADGDVPDLSIREAKLGDRYLICSDGLSDYVARDTIATVLKDGGTVEETAKRLVDLALRAGAPDNVTCVLADVVDVSTHPPTQPYVVGAVADRVSAPAAPPDESPAAKAAALRRTATGVPHPDEGDAHLVLAEEDSGPKRWLARIAVPVIVVLALVGGTFAAYDWTQRQLFLGASDGNVAVFRGVPQSLGPVSLYSVDHSTEVVLADLPDFARDAVQSTISVATVEAADSKVAELTVEMEACRAKRRVGVPCGSSAVTAEPSTTSPTASPQTTTGATGGATLDPAPSTLVPTGVSTNPSSAPGSGPLSGAARGAATSLRTALPDGGVPWPAEETP